MGRRHGTGAPGEGWREKLARRMGVPEDVFCGGDLAEIRGRRCLTVSGCGRILHYAPDRVVLQMQRYVLTVEGAGLHCLTYCAGSVGIDGRIDRVCFGGEGEA